MHGWEVRLTGRFGYFAPPDIERIAKGARGQWGVESMHWLLDVEFKDDLSRYRTGHGAKNMAVVPPLRPRPRPQPQSQGQHQDPPKAGRMEHRFSAAGAPDYPLTRIPCRNC
jgi:hypothetical protein